MHDERSEDVADMGASFASHPRPRRVWPVFAAFIVVVGGVLVGGGVLAVLVVVSQEGGMPPADELESRLAEVVLTAPVLVGSVVLSFFFLLSTSLVGAALSLEPLGERLRLRYQPLPLLAYPVAIVGLLVVGQTMEYLVIWLGLRDMSTLGALADAVARMPPSAFVIFLLVGSFGAGMAEEVFFRGYMQTRLTARWGVGSGVVVASMAFGALHFDPLHATLAFFMGIYLGWLAERSGSIVLPMVAHVGNNFLAFLMMRAAGSAVEAPVSYFLVSATLVVICVFSLVRLIPRRPRLGLSEP